MILKLDNGAVPIAFVSNNKGEGIVLAKWDKELVVWHWYVCHVSSIVYCEHGNYFKTSPEAMKQAEENFQKRAKQFLGWE